MRNIKKLDWYWRSGGAAAPPPFEWFESFASSQQPLANPLVIETGQSLDILSQNSEMLIADNYLKKIGASGYHNNRLRSVEAIEKGLGRLVGFKVIPNAANFQVGLVSPTTDSHFFQLSSSGLSIQAKDLFSLIDIGYTYVNDNVYYLFILLTDQNTAYHIILDNTTYYLTCISDFVNHTNHDLYISLANSTSTLIDWVRVNTIASLASQFPFDVDALATPSALTPFEHSAGSGWILFKIIGNNTSGVIEIKFRIQDANNYMSLKINSSFQAQISEVVASVENVLGAYAGVFTAGTVARIFFNGSNIRVFSGETSALKHNVTGSNFTSETDGEVTSLGNTAITYVHTMPFNITSIVGSLE